MINIEKSKKNLVGWAVRLQFKVVSFNSPANWALLELIVDYLQLPTGSLRINERGYIE
jgi:hypothetical protein